ncbi:MAG: hypothetical protein ACP5G4_00835 [bacterium]
MTDTKLYKIAIIALLICLLATTAGLVYFSRNGSPKPPYETAKAHAVTLVNNELYEQAYDQLDYIVNNYRLGKNEAGSILHQMGEIAAKHLRNPRLALSAYYKLKDYYPDHHLADQIERDIIEQLDKTGKRSQAQRLLEKSIALGQPASEVEPTKIIAKIGDRAISIDEIEEAISQLPPDLAGQFSEKQAKIKFARSYVGQQLMFEAALREGYDNRPEVIDRMESARKDVLANEYFKDNVANRVDVNPTDIEIYYEQHKSQFGGAPLDEVRGQVAEAARLEKMGRLQGKLLEDLLETQDVQFYPENM